MTVIGWYCASHELSPHASHLHSATSSSAPQQQLFHLGNGRSAGVADHHVSVLGRHMALLSMRCCLASHMAGMRQQVHIMPHSIHVSLQKTILNQPTST